jgi:LacI family transcriptional regulator
MLALREAGLSVPRDFAVVGYDDLPIASYTCPPLTTIRTHAFKQGKLLAEAAIALMNKEKVGSQQDVLPLDLIVRESCGAGPLTPTRSKTRIANSSSDRKPRKASASKGKHPGVEL